MPSLIQSEIDDRLAWQRPKAVICSVLLIVFVGLSVRLWRTAIDKSRAGETTRTLRERALLATGCSTVVASLLLMLMVIGNTQASFAPMGLTLFNA